MSVQYSASSFAIDFYFCIVLISYDSVVVVKAQVVTLSVIDCEILDIHFQKGNKDS